MSRFAIFFFKTQSGNSIAGADAADITALLKLFYREFSRPAYPEKADVLKAYLKIVRVKMERAEKRPAPTEVNGTGDYKFFEKFIIMVEREVFKVRKIEYYSNRIGITTRKLSAICRQYGNKSAKELIDERLISESKRMLRSSSRSIKEIALQIGFSDQYQFSKYFKKHVKSKILIMKIKMNYRLSAIVKQKCPICGKGDVYSHRKHIFELPNMNEDCEVCHYHFDREPGYFLGAMYASYGLAVGEGIAAFLLCYFLLPGLSTIATVLCVVFVILAMAVWNFKMSRVIWMNLFPN